MKLKITTFLVGMALFGHLQSQTQLDSLKMMYDSLPAHIIPTQLLHNQSPQHYWCFTTDTLLRWQLDSNYIASPYLYPGRIPAPLMYRNIWAGLFGHMWYSSRNASLIPNDSILNIRDSIAKINYDIPIGAMHFNFNRMLPGAIDSGYLWFDTASQKFTIMPDTLWMDKPNDIYQYNANPDSLAALGMGEHELFAGVLTQTVLYKPSTSFTVTFGLASSLFIENQTEQITYSEVDYDDGNGFQQTLFDVPKTITYNFGSGAESSEKTLRLRLHYGAKIVEAQMPLKLVPLNAPADDTLFASAFIDYCNLPTQHTPKEAKISIRYGNAQKKLLKPVLIIEGFESDLDEYGRITYEGLASGNVKGMPELKLMKNAFDSLHTLGYDIVYIDNIDGRDYVQANAMNAIKTIQWANQELINNGSHEKLVVIGASMGGLIARYALAKMEADGCCHNTRLYGTFDTPHNGAHIPVGLQATVRHLHDELGYVDNFLKEPTVRPNWKDVLMSAAARQMLSVHLGPSGAVYRKAFLEEFDSLGHPQQCRRIALTNGSENALGNTIADANKQYLKTNKTAPLPSAHLPLPGMAALANVIGIPLSFVHITLNSYAESSPLGVVFQGNRLTAASIIATKILATHGVCYGIQVVGAPLTLFPITAPFGQALITTAQSVANVALPALWLANAINGVFFNGYSTVTSNTTNFSESPGGTQGTPQSIADALKFKKIKVVKVITPTHSFIPTISALDIDTNDLYFKISDYRIPMLLTGKIPFDSYWAPGRGDNNADRNMKHVEVTHENYHWLIEQINLNDDLRHPQTGAYSKTLNGYYNFGHPADFDKPFLKHLYSVDIINGGTLYINRSGTIGYSGSAYNTASPSVFKCYTGKNCEQPYVRVQNGGLFQIGENLNNNMADMHFREASTLEIFNGGTLRINDNSSLVIEEGAELILHPGATIELLGDNAVLDLQGKVILEPNTTFTFTGSGFVRFNQKGIDQGNYATFWQYKGNNFIKLEGTDKFNKVAEIATGMHFPQPQYGLDSVHILNGLVEFPEFNRVSAYCPIKLNQTRFAGTDTSATASQEQFKGLRLYGQTGIDISHTDFVNGKFGIVNFSGVLGNAILNLNHCRFKQCKTGLLTDGGAALLKNCTFNKGEIGWHGKNITGSCNVIKSRFKHYSSSSIPTYGVYFVGQSSSKLSVNQSYFHNSNVGLSAEGTEFRSTCSHYFSNTYRGLSLERSEVNLDNKASNEIKNNQTGLWLADSKEVKLYNGFNEFNGNSGSDIYGTVLTGSQPVVSGSPVLDIYKNDFSNTSPIPVSLAETAGTPISLQNLNTQFVYAALNCPLTLQPGLSIGFSGKTMWGGLFYNGYLLHDAIEDNLDRMEEDIAGENSIDILNRWDEILDYSFHALSSSDSTLLEIAYSKELQALANAYSFGHVIPVAGAQGASIDPILANVLEHNQQFIDNQPTNNSENKGKFFSYNLDRAHLYRMGQHYAYALNVLSQSTSYSFTTNELDNANYWNCVCTAERAWFLEEIDEPTYLNDLQDCNSSYAAKSSSLQIVERSDLFRSIENSVINKVYPNPTNGRLHLELNKKQEFVSLELYSLTGVQLWKKDYENVDAIFISDLNLNSGTYFLKVNTSSASEILNLVIMN